MHPEAGDNGYWMENLLSTNTAQSTQKNSSLQDWPMTG